MSDETMDVYEDVYTSIADMIEPYVLREGIRPGGVLPASVHDSVAILLDHWVKTRAQVGEVQGATVEICGHTYVASALNASKTDEPVADWSKRGSQPTDWRNELLTLADHHGPIPAFARSAMRVIARSMPEPGAASKPVEFERAIPTYRREGAVKKLLALGWRWQDQRWIEPVVEAIPHGVAFSDLHDNFYDDAGYGMGTPFYDKWYSRRSEFPDWAHS